MLKFMSQSEFDEEVNQEDYFFSRGSPTSNDRKVYALVIYDIIENKKRAKFSKYLKGYGIRVQKSCFEVMVSQRKFEKMLNGIERYCESKDSVRVYHIHGKSEVYQWGRKDFIEDEDVVVL